MLLTKLHNFNIKIMGKSPSKRCFQSEHIMDRKFFSEGYSGGSFFLLLNGEITISIVKKRTYSLHDVWELPTCIRILFVMTAIDETVVLSGVSVEVTVEA